jgi:uncharacterized protein YbdZ (MbtH family)
MSWYDPDREDTTIYKVVINHEEQYSIWPSDRENPLGWKDVGKVGNKAEVLAYINEVWTDMRPLSLRRKMEEMEREVEERRASLTDNEASEAAQEDELVKRLATGLHAVEASTYPKGDAKAFWEDIQRGYVQIRFTETRGGTELGFKIEQDSLRLAEADFDKKTGSIHLEGKLKLNFVPVRCVADIEIETLAGRGCLVTE